MNKNLHKLLAVTILGSLLVMSVPVQTVSAAPLDINEVLNFNSGGDLGTYFTPDPVSDAGNFTASSTAGLDGTGAVNVFSELGLYTTVNSYELPTSAGQTLAVSAYFQYSDYECCEKAGIGFVASSSADINGDWDYDVIPTEPSLGISFGQWEMEYINESGEFDWAEYPYLQADQWYKIVFALVSTGVDDTYDVHMQIWNSDDQGNLYTLRAWRKESDVLRAELAGDDGEVHAYFGNSFYGESFTFVDDFEVTDSALADLFSGSGTEGDPYMVSTCAELQAVNIGPDDSSGVYYKLSGNIDCSASADWNDGEGFMPIGTKWGEFDGVFDGNYKTISDLYIDRVWEDYQGLFEDIGDDGVVRNLILSEFSIIGDEYIGVLAGESSGLIEQVGVEDADIGAEYNAGGLVGEFYDGVIARSYVVGGDARVTYGNGGGLVGYMDSGEIEDSYANIEVIIESSGNDIGGLVGNLNGGSITRSYSNSDLSASGGSNYLGGLVGEMDMYYWDENTLSDSFASGGSFTLDGDDNEVGGVVGAFSEGKFGESNTFVSNFFYNAGDLDCIGYIEDTLVGDCTEVDSVNALKSISNAPFTNWTIELSTNNSYNTNDGYPVLAWQAVGGDTSDVWLGFNTASTPEPPRSSSSGGRSTAARATAAVVNTMSDNSALIQQIIAEIKKRVEEMVKNGETIDPNILAFINSLGSTTTTDLDLEYGDQGPNVIKLQNLLMSQGHSIPAGATGSFLDQTRSALIAYQTANNILPASGYFGAATRAFMKAAGLAGLWW